VIKLSEQLNHANIKLRELLRPKLI
jgi:hypothetical protein